MKMFRTGLYARTSAHDEQTHHCALTLNALDHTKTGVC